MARWPRWGPGRLLLASVGALVLFLSGCSGDSAATTTTIGATTIVEASPLEKRTSELATVLRRELDINLDHPVVETAGVLVVDDEAATMDSKSLEAAGEETGMWGPADVERMLSTTTLDGTLYTADRATMWAYNPLFGLTITIDIKDE